MLHCREISPSVGRPLCVFFLCLLLAGVASHTRKQPNLTGARTVAVFPIDDLSKSDAPALVAKQPSIRNHPEPSATPKREKLKPKRTADPIAPPAPSIEDVELVDDTDSPQIMQVSDEEVAEFTTIEPLVVVPRIVVNTEYPLPYVPSSAFYFPDHSDSVASKKIVHL